MRVNRGPRGRGGGKTRRPRQLPPPLPATAMSRAAALGRTSGPPAGSRRSSGRCEAAAPLAPVTPSLPRRLRPDRTMAAPPPRLAHPSRGVTQWSRPGGRGSRRRSPAADQLGAGRAALFSPSKEEDGAVGRAETAGPSLGDRPWWLSYPSGLLRSEGNLTFPRPV